MFGTPVTVEATHRAILFRDGKFQDILTPGRHKIRSLGKRGVVEFHDTGTLVFSSPKFDAMFAANAELVKRHLMLVETSATQIALIRTGKIDRLVLAPQSRIVLWREPVLPGVELLDVVDAPPIMRNKVEGYVQIAPSQVAHATIEAGEVGLVYVDGTLRERLDPGTHGFWKSVRKVSVRKVDTRLQSLEVTAQEILTKDRVSIRVTLTAFWQVKDPVRAAEAVNPADQLYRHIQFAIRDSVASRSLDELLDARGTLDGELSHKVKSMAALGDLGLEVVSVGLKDVILPGDMREILNRVVEAQKQAQANLIARQEETAATRSLLNTARLMENNPLLLRMKELEALEKVTQHVGRIDVNTGGAGLDALLNRLVSLKEPDKAD